MERPRFFAQIRIAHFSWILGFLLLNLGCGKVMEGPKFDNNGAKNPSTTTPQKNILAPVILSPASYSISKTNSILLSGSCIDGMTVNLSGASSNSVTCANSSFSFPLTKTTDGIYTFNVSQLDSSGDASANSSVTWVLDTQGPTPPTITTPATNPHLSKGNSLTISGACETGATVKMSGGATASTPCVNSIYSFTVNQSTDGTSTYSILQTDPAGNDSSSTSAVWTRDTQAPSAPTVTNPSSNPFTSGDTTFTLSGNCETGATVTLSGAGTGSSTCAGGHFSFSVSKSADGTYNYSLSQTDPAGNNSAATSFQWNRDTSIPSTPTITSPSSSPWISNSNTLTLSGTCLTGDTVTLGGDVLASDVTSPSGSLTATCASGAFSFTLQKLSDAVYNFSIHQSDPNTLSTSANASFQWIRDTVAPPTPVITTPSTSPFNSNSSTFTLAGSCESGSLVSVTGNASATTTCSSSSFSFTLNQSVDGTYNFSVSETDPAGNSSSSASQQWQRNTVPPDAPTITNPSSPSYLSNESSLTISGDCSSGNTVLLSGDSTDSTTCVDSAYSFTANPENDGTYLYSVSQTDVFGNTSPTVSQSWVRDTVPPAAPSISSPTANPYTSGDNSLILSGSCESSATVDLSGASADSITCMNGIFSFTLSQSVNGTYDYTLTQSDLAGNTSLSTNFQWVRDNTIPNTPTITSPTLNPFYSNANSITISGACTATDTVNLGGSVIASEVTSPSGVLTQTCPSGGSYSFTIQKSADGSYTFLINQENPTTAVRSADASVVWNRDTIAPSAPVISNPAISPYTASGNLTISGTCENGATVKISGDSAQSTNCSGNSFSFTVTKNTDATYNFTLNQTDRAGNVSTNTSFQWVRDSSVTPSPVITNPSVTNYASNSTSLTISGTCITGNTITMGGNVTATEVTTPSGSLTQICSNSSFSYFISKSSDGTYSLTFKQTSAGQGDSALVTVNWTRDTMAPDTSIASNPSDPNLNVDAIFSFSSADTTSTFECQLDSGAYSACTSPVTYASISQGSHTFNVRAKDSVGNLDPSPATYAWTQMSYKTIALYHFTSGNSLSDSSLFPSPYTNDLADSTGTASVAGKFTDGQSFNSASSQYLSRADNASLRALNATMTFEAQVKFSSLPATSSYQVIASKSGTSGNAGWEVRVKRQGSNYYITFDASSDGTAVTEVKSTACTLDTTAFHHIAVTWNKGAVKFYLDGSAKGSGTIGVSGSTTLFASTAPLRLGRTETMNSTVTYFSGVLDELRLSQVLRWSSSFTAPSSEYTTAD